MSATEPEAKTIMVDAETVSEAKEALQPRVQDGLVILSTKVIEPAPPVSYVAAGADLDEASDKARALVPDGFIVSAEEPITQASDICVTVRAEDEHGARAAALLDPRLHHATGSVAAAKVLKVTLTETGRRGILGFGRTPNSYEVSVHQLAVAQVVAQQPTRVEAVIGPPPGVGELLGQLRSGIDKDAKETAIGLLSANGSPEAKEALLTALDEGLVETLEGVVVFALSRFERELARPALLRCLRDSDWFVRDMAASAIGSLDPKDELLTGVLVKLVSKAAGASLSELKEPLTPGVFFGPEAMAVLNNPAGQERSVLISAIKALAKLQEPTALKPLTRLAAKGEALHTDVLYNVEQAIEAIRS